MAIHLRNRLTLISSLIFGIIFACCSLIIYAMFYQSTQHAVQKELKQTTLLAAIYYLEKDEQPIHQHQLVKAQFNELLQTTQVAVFNEAANLQYGDLKADNSLLKARISEVQKQGKLFFKARESFYYGLFYEDNQGDFTVFIKINSAPFQQQMDQLLAILLIVLLVGWISIFLLSKYLTKLAYQPIRRIIKEVSTKDISKLQEPIAIAQTEDELQELLATYNSLLARVADTFGIQRNFVNYVSHEFRTPLTAITGELEVSLQKERTPAEYKEVSTKVLSHIESLTQIITNMLLLAGAENKLPSLQIIRVDELIWDCIERCQQELNSSIQVDFPALDPDLLLLRAVESPLKLACYNLLENAVKYSDNKPINLRFEQVHKQLMVHIQDQGIGISQEELPYVMETFYRGKEALRYKGSGIGLSLAHMVCKQYGIALSLSSTPQGTKVSLLFPSFEKE